MLRTTFTAFALALMVASGAARAQDAGDDPVAARVNGTEIHRSEVEALARTLPEQFRQMPLSALYGMLLDRAIDFQLLAKAAEQADFTDDPAVQDKLARARAGVLRDALVQQRIDDASTDEALRARYEEMKQRDDFARDEIHARHILLSTEDEAKQVIEQLGGGADFATLAGEKSIGPSGPSGGDLGYFSREQMVPEFAEAAFAIEPGAFSKEPVKTKFGWHVIEVLDRRTGVPSFEQSEPQIRQEVARETVLALVEELRAGAEIERFNPDGSVMQIAPGGDQSSGGGASTSQ